MLLGVFYIGSARVGIVLRQNVEHAREWNVIAGELVAVHFNLIRLDLAALTVDLNDAGDKPHLRGDGPVQNRAQLHWSLAGTSYFELVNFSQPGRDRSHLRHTHAGRNRLSCLRQAFADQVPTKVGVHAVLEIDGHIRKAVFRGGLDVSDARQPGHGCFYWKRQQLLDFQRRQAGSACED